MRKTKIICTLGPSADCEAVLREMLLAGMNVARLNFSHGSHEEHKGRADKIKKLRKELGIPCALMIDTKGPDIRVGRFKNNFVELQKGDRFTLKGDACEGDESMASTTYPELYSRLCAGDRVMLDDGLIRLTVEQIEGRDVVCIVENGGVLSNNKSVNIPGVKLDIPYMREKDIEDIHFAIDNDFDFIAASFVRSAADVMQIKGILKERGAEDIRIISKIENSEGIDNIDEILEVSDSIMVARGDMGVELPFEQLPSIQKVLIKKAQAMGKSSITATQMLESMITNPAPTRAETSDVANAIYDGTSAIMLSGETSVGKHPVEVIKAMSRIAETTEGDIDYKKRLKNLLFTPSLSVSDAISHATATIASDLDASAIVTLTQNGLTAMLVARYRPFCPILCCTPSEKVFNQLSLSWGCVPMRLANMATTDMLYDAAIKMVGESGIVEKGGRVVFTAGVPLGKSGSTNYLRVGVIGCNA